MKMLWRVLGIVSVFLIGFSFFACSPKEESSQNVKDTDKIVVAKVDDVPIYSDVLEKFFGSRLLPMNNEKRAELMKKRVDDLINEELMFREALRLKLDQEPDIRQRIRQLVNQRLIDTHINEKVTQRKIDQAELQAYYDAHKDEFNRAEEVRAAIVLFPLIKGASDEQRSELKKKAETSLAEVKATQNQRIAFAQMARKHPEQPARYAKGDTGFFSVDGKPSQIDSRIAAAAFQLEKIGDIADKVIETDDGYHIIMLTGRRAAFSRPFEQVSRHLERRIKNEEFQNARSELIKGLKAKTKVDIDEKALAQVQEKLTATSKAKPMILPGQSGGPSKPGTGDQRQVKKDK